MHAPYMKKQRLSLAQNVTIAHLEKNDLSIIWKDVPTHRSFESST